jgi:nicotinamidase-related amidase
MPSRHPLPLLTREVRPVDLTSARSLVLVQDLHAPFADVDGGTLGRMAQAKVVMREFDEYFDTLQLVAQNFPALLAAFRDARVPVAYSCLGHRASEEPSAFQQATGWTWNLDGPDGSFPDAWAPRDGEPVFAKPGWGALASPDFRRFLDERGVESVVIFGAMFDFGIRHTCYELADAGIGSLVVSDAVVALTRDGSAATAGNLAHGVIKLRSAGETLDLVKTLKETGAVRI